MKKEAPSLAVLADFLNFNFETGDPNELTNKSLYHTVEFMNWNLNSKEGIEEGKQLQSEILDDLIPIIPPAMSNYPKESYELIDRLIHKINGMGLIPEWGLEPVGYRWVQVGDPEAAEFDLEPIDSSEAEDIYRDLGPGQRVLGLLGYKWVVNTKVSLRNAPSLRHSLYWNIIDALENGELVWLRRCLNCWKFFVAEDLRQKYCTPECTKAADNEAAKKRVRKWRKKDAEEKQKQAAEAAERRGFKRFSMFMGLAVKKKRTREEGREMHPILWDLGKGDTAQGWNVIPGWNEKLRRGASLKNIWDALPQKTKQIFETA